VFFVCCVGSGLITLTVCDIETSTVWLLRSVGQLRRREKNEGSRMEDLRVSGMAVLIVMRRVDLAAGK